MTKDIRIITETAKEQYLSTLRHKRLKDTTNHVSSILRRKEVTTIRIESKRIRN